MPSWLVPKTPQGDSLTLRITGAHGPDQFLQLATSPDWSTEYLPRIRTLHLELNEEWQTDYVDDILAVALRSLCQHSGSREGSEHGTQEDGMQEKVGRKKKSNGLQGNGNHKKNDSGGLRFVDDDDDDELELGPSNSSSDNESSEAGKPHRTGPLREIHLQARGNFLFTHNSYSLRNPAAATSWVGSDCDRRAERLYPNLDRIAHGRQTVADREDIDIRVSEWPKAVVKALLELRVDKVVIDGPMDGSLKNELIETMTRIESENNEDDDGEDGVLKPGEVWEMERIERKVASRRPGVGSGKGRGRARASALNERSVEQVGLDFMFPTKEEHRVILGWRVE